MGLIGSIILGGISGWLATKFTGDEGRYGTLGTIGIGVVGGFVGGFIINILGGAGVTGFNLWSLVVSVIGAMLTIKFVNSLK